MKKMLMITGLILFLLSTATDIIAEERIRLTNGEYPPFTSEDLKYYGLASHIVTKAFAVSDIQVEYKFYPWARSYKLAKEGTWDGTIPWSRKPEREQYFDYSDPILNVTKVFFHLKKRSFDWKSIEDLKELTIGATLEYNYGKAFESAEKDGKIEVERIPADEMNFRKLLKGHIAIFPMDLDGGYDILYKNFKPQDIQLITHHPKPVVKFPYHLLLSKKLKKSKQLLILFNKGLQHLKKTGKYDLYCEESRKGEYRKK